DFRWRIVRVGDGDEINGKILCWLAKAGAVVAGIAIVIDQSVRDNRFRLRRWSIRIHQILIANQDDAFGQACQLPIGALDALDDESAGSSSKNLGFAKP